MAANEAGVLQSPADVPNVKFVHANDCALVGVSVCPAPFGMRPDILPVEFSERSLRQANGCSDGMVGVLRVLVELRSHMSNVGLYCRMVCLDGC